MNLEGPRRLLLGVCGAAILAGLATGDPGENVLIIVSDDIGVDRTPAYGYVNAAGEPIAPRCAALDQLAAEGLVFRSAWSSPVCSSSRAQALTGKYPNRTGIGSVISVAGSPSDGMRADELTLGDIVPASYRRAVIGKWHLAGNRPLGSLTGGKDHAPRCGFDHFAGSMGNLTYLLQSYTFWKQVLSNLADLAGTHQVQINGEYATSRTTDDALRTIEAFGEDPWLLWVSYNAAHTPLHAPPAHLIQSPDPDLSTELGQGKAMIEALDTEIGRLLTGIRRSVLERTTVIYFADNGTNPKVVEPPFDPERAKWSVYEGGVHVPLIVRSRRIPPHLRGGESEALIDLTDLLPTVAELVGVATPPGLDGRSFLRCLEDPATCSPRRWTYAEFFTPNFVPEPGLTVSRTPLNLYRQAARGARYKLLRERTFSNGQVATETLELYDLELDEFELNDLLDAQGNPPPALQSTYDALLRVLLDQAG